MAAVTAHYARGRATPIEKQDGLFMSLQDLAQGQPQCATKHAGIAAAQLCPHIYDLHRRQRLIQHRLSLFDLRHLRDTQPRLLIGNPIDMPTHAVGEFEEG